MVEFKAIERAFLHWRARATKNLWRMDWHRRNSKTVSMSIPESQQTQLLADSGGALQHPLIELPSPRLSSFDCIHASEVEEEYDQQIPSSLEDNGLPQIRLDQKHVGDIVETPENEGRDPNNAPEAELKKLYEELDYLSSKRVHARQSRMALKYKREDEVKLRVSLMRRLNSFFANLDHPEAEPMMREYQLLQVATEEYLRMENAYREEEDHLEELEYMVSVSMEGLSRGPINETASSIHSIPGPRTPVPNRAESIRELPSSVMAYLSRIGDERILHERLSELESEWLITLDRQAQRDQLDMDLDEYSREFLSKFDERRTKLWNELSNAQLDVNSLRDVCIEQGYSGFEYEDTYVLGIYQHAEEGIWLPPPDSLALALDEQFVFPEDTGANRHDELDMDLDKLNPETPQRAPRRESPSLDAIHQNSLLISSTDFINKWMLHQLRISSMGIWRLQRSPLWKALRDQGQNDNDIGRAILDAWLADDGSQAKFAHVTDDYADTVIEYAQGRREQEQEKENLMMKIRAQSLPSALRAIASTPKSVPRRHSKP
ncbi:hypothetical protein BDV18DRAFT_40943 [Aspergillus unguis]